MTNAEKIVAVVDDNGPKLVPVTEAVKPKKVSKLKAIDPQDAEPSKPKILIFGKSGVGKTWASLDFPSVYYIDTEGGANRKHYTDKLKASGGKYFGPEQGSQSFQGIIEEVKALATEDHPYKTLVLDSGSEVYDLAKQEAADTGGDDYGRDKKEANKPARKLTSWLKRIDMNVIIIAHQIPEWGIDAEGKRSQIGDTFDAWTKLDYQLDLALQIKKSGPRRFAKVTKSRLEEFPEASTFDWSYENFAKLYGKEVIEGETKALVLVTQEQLAEYKTLLSLWKMPAGQEKKWLEAAKVESMEDIDFDKMKKIIDYIKQQLTGKAK